MSHFKYQFKPSHDIDNYYHLGSVLDNNFKPVLSEENPYQPINLKDFFGSSQPIEIEIGCGKGNFMVEYCDMFPKQPFIAIDQEPAIAYFAAKRLSKRPHLKHTRVIHGDAFCLFKNYLSDNSVKAFHMYFLDPWPKKKHLKRRFVKPEYLQEIKRLAIPNAIIYWRTDHKSYHESASEIFNNESWITCINFNAEPLHNITTNFEKKYLKEGRPIYRQEFQVKK